MGNTDYRNTDLTILDMVYNRLRFLERGEENDAVIKMFVLEIMYQLEPCFQVGEDNIGLEEAYTIAQQSIIADLVVVYLLLGIVGTNSQSSSGSSGSALRFLKRAKAGSSEVEWDTVAAKDSSALLLSADSLIERYRKEAAAKARNLGCILDICDDCTASLDGETGALPFINVTGCGCGC